MQNLTRITVDEAARALKTNKEVIRAGVRENCLPIGVAVPGKKRNIYLIYKEFLDQFMKEGTK